MILDKRAWALGSLIQFFKAVSMLVNRGQPPIVFWNDPQFLSDTADMGVDRAGGHFWAAAPDILQNIIPGQYPSIVSE